MADQRCWKDQRLHEGMRANVGGSATQTIPVSTKLDYVLTSYQVPPVVMEAEAIVKSGPLEMPTPSLEMAKGRQTRTVFEDDFSDNHNGWPEGSDGQGRVAVRDGKYLFDFEARTKYGAVANAIAFSPHDDFVVECRVRHVKGPDNSSCGLLFGSNRTEGRTDEFQFLVNNNGSFTYIKYFSRERTTVIDWTRNPFYRKDKFNRLSVLKTDGKLRFFVNGYRVGETEYEPFFDRGFGFVASEGQSVEFDDFVVKVIE